MYCKNCGKLLRIALQKDEKCPHCEHGEDSAKDNYCPGCGSPINQEEKICRGCGISLLKKAEKG